jgi:NAD(P)-dependent dehydrogenase (short-subunit alcohol dehydrogenase family)
MNKFCSLEDKNIVITGASSGIGRQCAIACSQRGANVALVARNKERLDETFAQLDTGNHVIIEQNITSFDQLESMIETIVEQMGSICGFVHCAGVELTLPFRNMNPEKYRELFDINVISGFEIAKYITKKRNIDEVASLVFISSVMGLVTQPGLIGYSTSKGALISGVRTLAVEVAKKQIRANCISPGYIDTPLLKNIPEEKKQELADKHPLGLGNPEDVANAVVFLLSDQSRWITGSNIIVDGGYSLS